MRDYDLLQFLTAPAQREQACMLMVVVQNTAGSPGRQGFKMVVSQAGARAGTIGGGVMEYKLVAQAQRYLRQGDRSLHWLPQYHNQKAERWRSGMICAGSQIIVFCPLGPEHQESLQRTAQALADGSMVTITMGKDKGLSWHCLGEGGEASAATYKRQEKYSDQEKYSYQENGEGQWSYSEHLGPEIYMHIVGGGHVGLALARVMATLDAHITVFDHRRDLDTLAANHYAHRIVVGPYEEMGPWVREGRHCYGAIVSTSFKTDEAALRQLVSKQLRFLGVMGSKAKIKHLREVLVADGYSKELLDRVQAPIGLPIASHTTEEIAISIAGAIILKKNGTPQDPSFGSD